MYSSATRDFDPLLGAVSELSTLEANTEDATTIAVTGAVDMVTAGILRRHALHALGNKPPCLILDLYQVSFLGSVGLTLLLDVRRQASKQGTSLLLRARRHQIVLRTLELTGLLDMFTVVQ